MSLRLHTLALLALLALASASRPHRRSPFPGCRGSALYRVTFFNRLTRRNFGKLIPRSGLVYSPLAGVSHSNRVSLFTIRGFANKPTEILAETGVNAPFIRYAKGLQRKGYVKSVVDAGAPTMPGKSTTVRLRVDCARPFITVIGMIAPSPDWIVQLNNRNLFDTRRRRFIKSARGRLIAYDAGVDDGREFTPPLDTSLDMPTVPQKNIAPLVEDETDRFEGRFVGGYRIRRVYP